jgi:hypothetical protein
VTHSQEREEGHRKRAPDADTAGPSTHRFGITRRGLGKGLLAAGGAAAFTAAVRADLTPNEPPSQHTYPLWSGHRLPLTAKQLRGTDAPPFIDVDLRRTPAFARGDSRVTALELAFDVPADSKGQIAIELFGHDRSTPRLLLVKRNEQGGLELHGPPYEGLGDHPEIVAVEDGIVTLAIAQRERATPVLLAGNANGLAGAWYLRDGKEEIDRARFHASNTEVGIRLREGYVATADARLMDAIHQIGEDGQSDWWRPGTEQRADDQLMRVVSEVRASLGGPELPR